ncbi:hypothetical protein [Dysgonomonas sp. 520]|uniref:hypothetical protein n=1 Tax=Dysgonomonas sp. 520 TaxID=2302931 RepID=UPI0013D0B8F9|nr:hypothetical protein [Dysgonomonas sp. 520]NDW10093.1 hypothetical protein [Dysgonomonas sp. 520]
MQKYVDIKQLLVRLAILIGVPIATLIVSLYSVPQSTPDKPKGDVGLGCIIFAIAVAYFIFFFLIGEAIYLYYKKKTTRGNANSLLIIAAMIVNYLFNPLG